MASKFIKRAGLTQHDPSPLARVLMLVKKDEQTGCWVGPWATTKKGYVAINIGRRKEQIYRFVYAALRGPIPQGLTLDHLCRNRRCFNPDHLEPVTMLENILRGTNSTKTRCKRGHELSGDNVLLGHSRTGRVRVCRACRRMRDRERRRRR
jgi:hypothetical protein